jgi:cytochrome c-type biogenesis protein CcmH
MIIFWLTVVVMVAVALAFVVPALTGRTRVSSIAHKQLNIALYKERFAELETELRDGVLSQEQFAQAREDLERNLLHDVEGVDQKPSLRQPKGLLWTSATAIALPALAVALYLMLGDAAHVDTAPAPLTQSAGQQAPDMHSVQRMVEKLSARLQREPNDTDGWVLLGRSYMALQRYGEAIFAFARAHELKGDDPQLLADYAEAFALANGNRLEGRPTQLATRALELQPDNPKALWLAGVAAMQRGDRSSAVGYLQRLQKHLPANSEAAKVVATYLAQTSGATMPAPATNSPSVPSDRTGATAPTAPPGARVASATARLEVNVTLDPALATRAAPGDTVFIFAQASQGPKMPLAIVRKQVKALPVTVTLDDSMAMMPAMRLSQFKEVVVGARVSKSGQATPRSGDLEGRTGLIRLDSAKTVKVTIDRVRP